MILGLTLHAFTELHVAISLIAIAAGLIVLLAMLTGGRASAWTGLFLIMTVPTSVTGFLFPRVAVTPAQIVGAISLGLLALALLGYYAFRLRGPWRFIYVITALFALYLNCFVAVVQAFLKIPALNALAPNGNEPPFMAAQGALLLIFLILGFLAVRKFHPAAA
jgi:hypothetical protein